VPITSERVVNALERWVVGVAGGLGRRLGGRILHHAVNVPNARFSGFTLVVPFLALVAIPVIISDSVMLNAWIFDYSLPLDTSLRWLYGHIPHLDYQTPIGASYWLLQGVATDLFGGADARTPILANFIAVLLIIAGTIALTRSRLSGGIFGLLILAGALLVISPRSPGDIPGQISFLAAYNKAGLSILVILLVGMFVEPRQIRSKFGQILDASVIGLFLLWLVYLKVSFAGVAFVGCIAALHYAPRNRSAIVLGVALTALGIALIGWLSGINAAYLSDISDTAAAGGAVRFGKMLRDVVDSRLTIVVFLLCVALYWRMSAASPAVKRSNLVVSFGLFLAGIAAMNQVHDNYLALSFLALLVLAQRSIGEANSDGGQVRYNSFVPPLIGAVALVTTATLSDAISSVHYHTESRKFGPAGHPSSICDQSEVPVCRIVYQVFDASGSDWVVPLPSPTFASPSNAEGRSARGSDSQSISAMLEACDASEDCLFWKIQEQLYLLLNQHIRPEDKPLFLGFSNILPYYYQVEPPKNVPAWMDFGRNISEESHPSPQTLFSDITLLAVPRVNFKTARMPGLNETYQDDIPAYFDLVAETDSWAIWRRH